MEIDTLGGHISCCFFLADHAIFLIFRANAAVSWYVDDAVVR